MNVKSSKSDQGKELSNKIESGRPVTLNDIAVRLNIHVSTVSLALRNHPRISKKRREEIQKIAHQLGYRPNTNAATLVNLRRRNVAAELGWVNCWRKADELREFKEFDLYWKGAFETAEKRGYRLEEFRMADYGSSEKLSKVLRNRGIQGVLVAPYKVDPDSISFISNEFEMIKFGLSPIEGYFNIVTSHQALNTRLAFQKMEEYGYRRIGFVTRRNDTYYTSFRAGYLIAQQQSSLPHLPPLTFDLIDEDLNLDKLNDWLREAAPDAIFTDIANLRFLLKRLGRNVPDDIGLAGTTILDVDAEAGIDQQSYYIGKAAAEWLVSMVQNYEKGVYRPNEHFLIEGKWVDGKSLPRK